jgi:hypothetical protein
MKCNPCRQASTEQALNTRHRLLLAALPVERACAHVADCSGATPGRSALAPAPGTGRRDKQTVPLQTATTCAVAVWQPGCRPACACGPAAATTKRGTNVTNSGRLYDQEVAKSMAVCILGGGLHTMGHPHGQPTQQVHTCDNSHTILRTQRSRRLQHTLRTIASSALGTKVRPTS